MTKTARSCDSLAIGGITPKTWENTTFLIAKGLEHRNTRFLEGSSMAVGGEGAAGLGTS